MGLHLASHSTVSINVLGDHELTIAVMFALVPNGAVGVALRVNGLGELGKCTGTRLTNSTSP